MWQIYKGKKNWGTKKFYLTDWKKWIVDVADNRPAHQSQAGASNNAGNKVPCNLWREKLLKIYFKGISTNKRSLFFIQFILEHFPTNCHAQIVVILLYLSKSKHFFLRKRKQNETLSASCWMGALLVWASSTRRTIWLRAVSSPTWMASTKIKLFWNKDLPF